MRKLVGTAHIADSINMPLAGAQSRIHHHRFGVVLHPGFIESQSENRRASSGGHEDAFALDARAIGEK